MIELMIMPRDMHNAIALHLNLVSAARMRRVNKYWHELIKTDNYDSAAQLMRRRRIHFLRHRNPLKLLVDENIICSSPDSSFVLYEDIVENHKNWRMNWGRASMNPNISVQHIIDDCTLRDSIWWSNFSQRSDVTIDVVLKYPKLPWSWPHLCININVTEDVINKYPNLPWTEWIASNKNLSIEFILSRAPNPPTPEWYYRMSSNPNLSPEMLQLYPEAAWNMYALSHNIPMLEKIKPMVSNAPHLINNGTPFHKLISGLISDRSAIRPDLSVLAKENARPRIGIVDVINNPKYYNDPYCWLSVLGGPTCALDDIIDDPIMLDRFAKLKINGYPSDF